MMTAHRRVNGGARWDRKPGYLEFKAALLELSDDPSPATLVRYLNASRGLERALPISSTARTAGEQRQPKIAAAENTREASEGAAVP
jgi:hypothetical protein